MTEQQWLACTDTRLMLETLHGKASERKWRLFACACCRLVWHLLPDLCHRLVEAVEQYADKESKSSDLVSLFKGYYPHPAALSTVPGGKQALAAVAHLGWEWRWGPNAPGLGLWDTSCCVARSAAEALAKSMPWEEARQLEQPLLHDIFGPLAFRPIPVDLEWRRWSDGVVVRLVHGIYEERAFDRLPILADALEEAGCFNRLPILADALEEAGSHTRTADPVAPFAQWPKKEGSGLMTHVVCEPCYDCKDTDCVVVCPTECFWQDEKMLYIDPASCIDCEACIPECPVEAIFWEDERHRVPEHWRHFIELNSERASALRKAGEDHISEKVNPQEGPRCRKL
jgi:ferredoxin